MVKSIFILITASTLCLLSVGELHAETAKKESSEKRTVILTIYKKEAEKGKTPADQIVGRRNTVLRRVKENKGSSKAKTSPMASNYDLQYEHTQEPPIRIKIKTRPGKYRLRLTPSYYHPYGGSKYFEIHPEEKSEQPHKIDFVLDPKPFSICTLRAINDDTKEPLSDMSFRGYHQGDRVRLYNWKKRELFEQGKREQAQELPSGGTTGENGYIKFPLWDDINTVKFKVFSNRIADDPPGPERYSFTVKREELKKGATVSLSIRPITVIIRPYLRTKEGNRKRLTTDVLRKITPEGEKDEVQDWKLICYKLPSTNKGERKPYWSFTFDREKAAFVWRAPYPKSGDNCELNDCIKMTTRDGKVTYPVAEDGRRFTVPAEENLPYEGETTVLLDESQLEHPPVKATGTVLTPDREPVEDATVKIINTDTQETKRTGTDERGTFKQKLSPARYKVRISKHGYLPQQATWKVSAASKRKDFALTPKSKLVVTVNKANGEPVSRGGVRLIPKRKDNPDSRREALHKGKALSVNLNPGQYTVIYFAPPDKKLEAGNIHFMRSAVDIGTGEKKSMTMTAPENPATVQLRIDRSAADIAEDRPLMLLLHTQIHDHEIRATGKILGEKNSLTLKLPTGATFKPEVILGRTDKAIREFTDPETVSMRDPDRYQDTTAYFGSKITIPQAAPSQEKEIDISPKKDTKHKFQK